MNLKKYHHIFQISWQNGFVYQTSVFLWRFRQFLSTIMALTIWSVVFSSTNSAFSYDRNEMITYIFLASFLQSVVLTTALHGLGGRVYSGEISNQLLKPVSLWGYLMVEEIADKLKNIFFIIIETVILFFIFKPELILPSLIILLLFITWILLGTVMNFFITLLFGSIGFWSPDSWGPKFLFFIMIEFTTGKMFPLDILPAAIQNILNFTPFPYLTFTQTQLFLGKIASENFLQHTSILLLWCGVLGFITSLIWRKGLKDYAALGQ